MGRRRNAPVNVLFQWVRRRSIKVKIFLGAFLALCGLVGLKFWVGNHDHFFIASEAIHFMGIIVLIHKLTTQKTCSDFMLMMSLFVARFGYSHINIYMIWFRFKLKSTYIKDLDNFRLYFVVVPAALLALFFHPYTLTYRITRVLWAFCGYLEAVSLLLQLRLMQNAKMIEPFTSHYVFALGVSRFFACAHWIIMIYETKGRYVYMVGSGYFWILAALLCEIVQTFILADLCYYYIKSYVQGQLVMRMPV